MDYVDLQLPEGSNTLRAFKLMRFNPKTGAFRSLFINKSQNYFRQRGWYTAEDHPTKGFAPRAGFHTMALPRAPHLKMKLASGEVRMWVTVEISDFAVHKRPESQGGLWFLSKYMRIIRPTLPSEIENELRYAS